MHNVLNRIFVYINFFCAILSFSDMVDFIFNSELGKSLQKSGRDFAKLIQTLTSEVRVLNRKACAVQWCSPGERVRRAETPPKKFILVLISVKF